MCWCTQSYTKSSRAPRYVEIKNHRFFGVWMLLRLNKHASLLTYSYTSDTTKEQLRKFGAIFSRRRLSPGLMIGCVLLKMGSNYVIMRS